MPQQQSLSRNASRAARTGAARRGTVLGAALVALVVGLHPGAARAGDDDSSSNPSAWSKFMQTLGLTKAPEKNSNINYSERSPLVVPPTRDLPPPLAELPPAADWPQDAPSRPHRHVRPKSAAPATTTAPAAAPAGANGSAAGQPGQSVQAGQASQVARVPNPTVEPKSIWNPKTWFRSEEYATFVSEPEREKLTDPPAGYRTPSPNQPYGIGPEKKKEQPVGAGPTSALGGSGSGK